MHFHSEALIRDLSAKAQSFRIQVLKMIFSVQTGHLGGAFSVAEILTSLYFHHMKIDPERPDWPERDRLLFSKGHACAMLYTAMANRGYFPVEELMTFRTFNSRLQGHPDRLKLPGIEMPAGPLGHGIAVGAGMALAARLGTGKPSAASCPIGPGYQSPDLCGDWRWGDQCGRHLGRRHDGCQVPPGQYDRDPRL